MQRDQRSTIHAMVLVLLVSGACGGGSSSPTEPPPPEPTLTVAANLDGLGAEPNLLEVALLWDGEEIGRATHLEPQLNVGIVEELVAEAGTHRVAMRVVRQEVSPGSYDLNGSLLLDDGDTRISLGHTEAELATGQSVATDVEVTDL